MSPRPLRFGLLGHPVAHSRSPRMHAAAYRALGLPHVYEAFDVDVDANPDALAAKVAQLRQGALAGLNVTVPHKVAALALVDALDPGAFVVGAVNTLVCGPGGRVTGHNTDAPALAGELRALSPGLAARVGAGDGASDGAGDDATGLVLGAGGAARSAIVAMALDLGLPRVVVRARGESAGALVVEMTHRLREAGCRASLVAEPLIANASTEARVVAVVQATSAGMVGKDAGLGIADAVAWGALAPSAVAVDAVYAPPVTPFVARARAHGVPAVSGLGMLARQGALAFALWLGGDVGVVYDAMLRELAADAA